MGNGVLVHLGFILNAPIVIVQLYLKSSFLFLVDASTDGTQWSKVGLLNVGPFYNLCMGSGEYTTSLMDQGWIL